MIPRRAPEIAGEVPSTITTTGCICSLLINNMQEFDDLPVFNDVHVYNNEQTFRPVTYFARADLESVEALDMPQVRPSSKRA